MTQTNKINPVNVTNEYLYGMSGADGKRTMQISHQEYMQGPGRFANASQIKILDMFMHPENYRTSHQIPPGHYTKKQMQQMLTDDKVDNAHIFHQGNYNDDVHDKLERTYVWGSTAIKMHDNIEYVVETSGNRYIKNFALIPENDNFDFKGDGLSELANKVLQPLLDPYQDGKTVHLNIDIKNVPTTTFTKKDFEQAKDKYKEQTSILSGTSELEIIKFLLDLRKKTSSENMGVQQINIEKILKDTKFYSLNEDEQSQAINSAILADNKIYTEQNIKLADNYNFGISDEQHKRAMETTTQENDVIKQRKVV